MHKQILVVAALMALSACATAQHPSLAVHANDAPTIEVNPGEEERIRDTARRMGIPEFELMEPEVRQHLASMRPAKVHVNGWPAVEEYSNSFIGTIQAAQDDDRHLTVLFLVTQTCIFCERTAEFWKKNSHGQVGFYVVDASQMNSIEHAALHGRVPDGVPLCIIMSHGKPLEYGRGQPECTIGLAEMIDQNQVHTHP